MKHLILLFTLCLSLSANCQPWFSTGGINHPPYTDSLNVYVIGMLSQYDQYINVFYIKDTNTMFFTGDFIRFRRLSSTKPDAVTDHFVMANLSGELTKTHVDSLLSDFLTEEVDGSVTNEIELPSQTGNAGKILSTNGTSVSWSTFTLSNSASLDFPNTNASESSDLTLTLSGASLGDVVSLGIPTSAILNHTSYTAWVSASDTITVRLNNHSIFPADPTPANFKVTVIK